MLAENIEGVMKNKSTQVNFSELRNTEENKEKTRQDILHALLLLRHDFADDPNTWDRLDSEDVRNLLQKKRGTYFSSILNYLHVLKVQNLIKDPDVAHTAELFLGTYRDVRRFNEDYYVLDEDVANANETLDRIIGDLGSQGHAAIQ